MYEAFFGMTGTPFARNIPPEQLYENRSLREILGRLMYVADKNFSPLLHQIRDVASLLCYAGLKRCCLRKSTSFCIFQTQS